MIEIKVPDPKRRLNQAFQKAKQKGFLRLANMELTSTPEEVHKFNEVTLPGESWWQDIPLSGVDLSNNEIFEIDPRISNLIECEVFKMMNNKVSSIPSEFLNFESLKILDLSGNQISQVPQEIGNQSSLVEINLGNNNVSVIPESVAILSNLENLKLMNNKLETLPEGIGQMRSLKILDLTGNQIEQLPFEFRNPELQSLIFSKNRISYIAPGAFDALQNLKFLDFNYNRLTEFTSFPTSENLEAIILSFNSLRNVEGFSNAVNLATLDLKNNKLKNIGEEIFLLDKLKLLDLTNNDLNFLPPELGLMHSLSKILIEGNPLKSIRIAIRQGGTSNLKKYLATKIDPEKVNALQEKLQSRLSGKELEAA